MSVALRPLCPLLRKRPHGPRASELAFSWIVVARGQWGLSPLLLTALLGAGCLAESNTAADPESLGDSGASGGTGGAVTAVEIGIDEGGTRPIDAGSSPPPADAAPPPPPPPADMGLGGLPPPPDAMPPPPAELCEAFCARLDECLPRACPGLDAPPSALGLCDLCGALPAEEVAKLVNADCPAVNQAVFGVAPDLRERCRGGTEPPDCAEICVQLEECGATGIVAPPENGSCEEACATLPPVVRECLGHLEGCRGIERCVNLLVEPETAQRCANLCERTAACVYDACAPGTLPPGYADACTAACIAEPPTLDEFRAFQASNCGDIVAGVRARVPDIDARCDNTGEDACALLCAERIVPCGEHDAATCAADCAAFAPANLLCLQGAAECDAVAACFGDPDGQARCQQVCDRIQACLSEACPPRVIPPELSVGCAAGCLAEPPDAEQVQAVAEATCAEVRRLVYRNNQELAPVCEGGRDFRPTGDECAAFCDNALEACLGVGGRPFCLAGCASLTREQYTCALEAQGECAVIDACLAGP